MKIHFNIISTLRRGSLQIFPSVPCRHFFCFPYLAHAPPTSFILIWSPDYYLLRSVQTQNMLCVELISTNIPKHIDIVPIEFVFVIRKFSESCVLYSRYEGHPSSAYPSLRQQGNKFWNKFTHKFSVISRITSVDNKCPKISVYQFVSVHKREKLLECSLQKFPAILATTFVEREFYKRSKTKYGACKPASVASA